MAETAPYFELNLMYRDGRQVEPTKYATLQDAMTAAVDHPGAFGAIWFGSEGVTYPVRVVEYNADGTIEVGAEVPEDDEDEPWTEEELAANFANGRELTDAERAKYGISK
jgi:hypothetical protein